MAEVRIPTEQIPMDILQRLQDIVDRKSLMGTMCRGTAFTCLSAPSQLFPSSASLASSKMSVHPSPLNLASHFSSFASSQSAPYSQSSNGTLYSMANLPSAASSAASSCVFPAASVHYSSATSAARMPTLRTQAAVAGADEVDGGSCDPAAQLSGPSPRKRRLVDVLDESGIVRVFPGENNLKTTEMDEHKLTAQKDSEIVRIFPDIEANKSMMTDSNIVRALTPVHLTPRPGSVHVFDNSRELLPRKEWNFKPLDDSASQSGKIPSSPRPALDAYDATSRRSSRLYPGHCETTNKHSSVHNSDSACNKSTSGCQSHQVKQPANEADNSTNSRHFSSSYSRRSPELPTPPQTPDDGDDEVFTFTVGNEEKYLSQTSGQATKRCMESTPRRKFAPSRHLSDRPDESCHHVTHRSSSFGPSQQMSDMSFGDRQKSRKRLSFDDVMATKPANTNQHSYSHLPSIPQFPAQGPTSIGGNLFLAHASRVAPASSNKSASPLPTFHPQLLASPFLQCPSSQSSPQPHHAAATTNQTATTTSINRPPPSSASDLQPSCRRSPVQDVFAILEKAVQKQAPGPPRRSRLHSDSEYSPETQSQGLTLCGQSSPQQEGTNVRRQTFSFGSRQHRDVEHDDLKPGQERRDSPAQMWSREQTGCRDGDCYCSKIARNFLQMVERAYTGISQMDGTQAGFVRFRQELTQTNDILRESLNIVHNIRGMCQHNVRSLSGLSAAQAQ